MPRPRRRTPARRCCARTSSGSSPTSRGPARCQHFAAVRAVARGHSRARPRRRRSPRACRCRTSAITTGVLPAPPATTLPTTITGTPRARARSQPSVQRAPQRGQRTVEQRQRPQQRRPAARGEPGAQQPVRRSAALQRASLAAGSGLAPACAADCVAKVICVRPARRAASITVITDWCAALASALMMTTRVLAGHGRVGQRRAPARRALRPATGCLLTA